MLKLNLHQPYDISFGSVDSGAMKEHKHIAGNIEQKALDILQYIQRNIYEPQRLKSENISAIFALSTSYLGTYFKRNVGETLQNYITNYKLKLIEHRLKFSDKRLNEIAEEFGFTDTSHLNKFLRKQGGSNLKTYRSQPHLHEII